MKKSNYQYFLVFLIFLFTVCKSVDAQFRQQPHKEIPEGVIPVTTPGNYGNEGATYMLMNDISCAKSAIFLGRDVTLDLNGYTISYADGGYGHVTNYGFEEGLKGWDVSKAPGARIENTAEVHAFIGKKLLRLKAGDVIASDYVNLPLGGRSYCAICGVTGNYYEDMEGDLSRDMRVSIFVDDDQGREIRLITKYGDSTRVSCPLVNRSTQLGGGFVFAHLNNLPAGKYRIRVKAENDCLVDEIDIRPSFDVGIGIVGKTHPMGHYDHLYNRNHTAFFDYTTDVSAGRPIAGIPVSEGRGNVIIKNGTIKNGTIGFISWGIQSTAGDVRIILDNIKIITSGINSTAVDVEQATITNCTFDVTNPFIINRHGAEFYGVDLRGNQPSEVSFSEFYGGQGCLAFKGDFSRIHHNHLINRQVVTNHYSIMAMGDSSQIFSNLIEPETGSGIEIYVHRGIDIFDNEFHIKAAPPSCEYHLHLSTNAIRIADYGATRGAANGCFDNRIYGNKFYISGKKYREYPNYIPMASAFFYSASAGDNEVFGNEIHIDQADPGTDAEAFAFYIGNSRGGKIFNNKIVSNVTPVWVGSSYGKAEKTYLTGNTFERSTEATADFKPVKMGSLEQPDYLADGTEFHSNNFIGMNFGIDQTTQDHKYTVFWTLIIKLADKNGNPAANKDVLLTDVTGKEVLHQKSGENGFIKIELPEYFADGAIKTYSSPYKLKIGKIVKVIELNSNSEVEIVVKQD